MRKKGIGTLEEILRKGFLVCLYESGKNNFTICVTNQNEKEICQESEDRLSLAIKKAYLQIFGQTGRSTNDDELRIIERWLHEGRTLSLSWKNGLFCIEAKEIIEVSSSKSKEILGRSYNSFRENFFYFKSMDIDRWPIFKKSLGKSILVAFLALSKSEGTYAEPSKILCSL